VRKSVLAALLVGASALPANAFAQPADPASPLAAQDGGSDRQEVQDIVVTAQRREESLQKVPVAVTAIGAAQLQDLRVTSIKNIGALSPGLQISTQGRQTVPIIIIRGISSGATNTAVDPKVGIYVDGVYVGRLVGSTFDLADVDRIEVLRGPQGTLFGRNATGGAISIITSAPTGKFGVKGTVSYGNYDAKRAKISIDLPAFGPFSAHISYLHDDIDGDIRNLVGGRTYDLSRRIPSFGTLTAAKRLGGRNIDGVFVGVRGEFGNLTADYRFDYTDARSVGRGVQSFGILPADSLAPLLAPIIARQDRYGGITNISTERLDAVANASSLDRTRTQGHSLTLTLRANDALTVKSISAYRRLDQDPSSFDLGASGGLLFTRAQFLGLVTGNIGAVDNPANAPGPNDSFFSMFNAYDSKQWQISQETQFNLTLDTFDLTAGAFYYHEHTSSRNFLGTLAAFTDGVYIPTTPVDRSLTRVKTSNDSFALYAQGTYHLTDQFDLTGGLRYSIDDRDTNILELSGAMAGALGVGEFKASFSRLTYSAIATWRPSARITAYAKVSSAYVAGGVVNGTVFKPEDLTAYEIGLKTQLFDNRMRANLSVYQNDYKDLQTLTFQNGVSTYTNAGKARIRGFEAELEAVPVSGLTLSGNLAYTGFDYKSYILAGVQVADIASPVFMSKWTGRVSAAYSAPKFSNGAHVFARLDGSYRSGSHVSALPIRNPDGSLAAIDRFNRVKGFWLVDGRIGIADIPLGGSLVSLSAFGQNLLDKSYWLNGQAVFQLVRGAERGRTYGIELGFQF